MLFSGWRRWEGGAGGKFEGGKGVIRRAEGVDVLAFGREKRPFGVEKVEGGRAAQSVADRCDAIDVLGLGEEVIADEGSLSQRG
jgi:hypothetical protein